MALVGTTIFSHILPVIFGFFALVLIISGSLEDDKAKLALGATLFIIACVFPYVILSLIV
jgi:hypothetical protein